MRKTREDLVVDSDTVDEVGVDRTRLGHEYMLTDSASASFELFSMPTYYLASSLALRRVRS